MDEVVIEPGQVINAQQAAEILHCSSKQVRRYAQDGSIPAQKLPGNAGWLFDRADVEEFIRPSLRPKEEAPDAPEE